MKSPRTLAGLAAAALLAAGALLPAPAAGADTNPYQRGPDPTPASVAAETGPFAIASQTVPGGSGPGFGNGTIYYPTDTRQGTFGAVTVIPGFLGWEGTLQWLGPRLASQGFVVMTLNPLTPLDPPFTRGDELVAALKYLTTTSPVKDRIDPHRLGVIGWSMGGGGALRAAAADPDIKADVALSPWDIGGVAGQVSTPTLIFGGDWDTLAPTGLFGKPFYDGLKTGDKALIQLRNVTHFHYMVPNTPTAEYSLVWLKRFVDKDTRYDRFLCPDPGTGDAISEFTIECPLP
ncbi:alpha/beta hydrolase [Actinomadura sp. NPDC048394]|uniref:poly(ethylene terephthalate) hydrolase family protein n=1 Tax=Actinomadura sp. NPDC048394 TaxID=3158223 RepID=UPI0033D3636E